MEAAQELALHDGLRAAGPALVVVVSDLHLGEGVDGVTGRYARTENFFADDAFARLLARQRADSSEPALLVLNGDILDFLRITDVPAGDRALREWQAALERLGDDRSLESLAESVSRHERRYGLHTHASKSVFKFAAIARGHPRFFQAVADWVRAGGWVLYVKGNHDLEQYWPVIRRAFRDQLVLSGADPGDVASRVCFADHHVTLANLRIEHGHQYEGMTRVAGPATLPRLPDQLNLPPGSFVNRYIINRLERIEPFLDNAKPVTDVLRTMVRRRPVSVISIIGHGLRFLRRALLRRRVGHAALAMVIVLGGLSYLVPVVVVGVVLLAIGSPGFLDWLTQWAPLRSPVVQAVLGAGGVALPLLIGAVRELWRWAHRPRVGEDEIAAGVHEAMRRDTRTQGPWRRLYAVLGHTHSQDVQRLPPLGTGSEEVYYVNTGTWAPLWPKDRPDLAGRTVYSFARFAKRGDEYVHEALVWNDAAGRMEPPVILSPE